MINAILLFLVWKRGGSENPWPTFAERENGESPFHVCFFTLICCFYFIIINLYIKVAFGGGTSSYCLIATQAKLKCLKSRCKVIRNCAHFSKAGSRHLHSLRFVFCKLVSVTSYILSVPGKAMASISNDIHYITVYF